MVSLLEIIIIVFCSCVAVFLIYMAYLWYLKKFRGYLFENGIPDAAILRQPNKSIGNVGFKHFSAVPYRTSQISLDSADRANLMASSGRPHTFPLTSSGKQVSINPPPEIRIDHIV